jgi:hypothetical protein
MEVLKTAAGEAQETIGKSLVDSLGLLSEDGTVQGLADAMQSFADFTADAIYGLGSLAAEFKNLKAAAPDWLVSLTSFTKNINPAASALYSINKLRDYGSKKRNEQMQNPSVQMFFTDQANQRLNNQKLKTDKEIVKATKTNTAELKKQAATKKQAALFDLEKIGLVAALQGKISEEEKLRLNLQLALLTGNDTLAAKLSAELAKSIDSTGKLAKDLTTLPDAKNPFEAWSAFLDGIIAKAKYAATISGIAPAGVNPPPTNVGGFNVSIGASTTGVTSSPNGDIIINIAGSVTSEEDLVAKIRAGIQSGSLSGKQADIGRLAGMFG